MPNNYLIVDNFSQLQNLQNHELNEIVYCQDEQKMYRWNGETWGLIVPEDGTGLTMNLYDLNKNVINQLKPLTNKEIKNKLKIVNTYYTGTSNKHYMLLCREYGYYTIFEKGITTTDSFIEVVEEIIAELGNVYSIELTEDKLAIELWIKPIDKDEPLAFYLFAYDAGVVYYG